MGMVGDESGCGGGLSRDVTPHLFFNKSKKCLISHAQLFFKNKGMNIPILG